MLDAGKRQGLGASHERIQLDQLQVSAYYCLLTSVKTRDTTRSDEPHLALEIRGLLYELDANWKLARRTQMSGKSFGVCRSLWGPFPLETMYQPCIGLLLPASAPITVDPTPCGLGKRGREGESRKKNRKGQELRGVSSEVEFN